MGEPRSEEPRCEREAAALLSPAVRRQRCPDPAGRLNQPLAIGSEGPGNHLKCLQGVCTADPKLEDDRSFLRSSKVTGDRYMSTD